MPRVHAWEEEGEDARDDVPPVLHAWEVDDHVGWDGDEDSEEEEEEEDMYSQMTPAQHAMAAVNVLMSLFFQSSLAAHVVCVVCYHLVKAGMQCELMVKLAKAPGGQASHYSRRIAKVTGYKNKSSKMHYELGVPGHSRNDISRTINKVLFIPPHEPLLQEYDEDPTLKVKLKEAIDGNELPVAYYSHPLVQANPEQMFLPLAFYFDGLPYSQTDSVLGFFVYNLVSKARHLVGVFRKRLSCACGCGGWCSLWPIFAFFHWSFESFYDGVYPSTRDDGSAFSGKFDEYRARLAGVLMSIRGILLHLKGDWAEYTHSLGLPNWASNIRPCLLANCHPDTLYDPTGINLLFPTWELNTDADYDAACRRCEVVLFLNEAQRRIVSTHLRYDKRKQGARGRALIEDLPGLGLKRDDRLEPSPEVPDIGNFEQLTIPAGGLRSIFWRKSEETVSLHRNPLFKNHVISLYSTLCLDVLHTWYLGVMLVFAKTLLWKLLMCGAFGHLEATRSESLIVALMQLRHKLWSWYRQRARSHPGEVLTRVHDLVPAMVGTYEKQRLKTKGAETWGMLLFLMDVATEHQNRLGEDGPVLLEAGHKLIDLVKMFKAEGMQVPQNVVQQALDTFKRHMTLIRRFEIDVPKHHLTFHLIIRSLLTGNPLHASTFEDEALNKVLKQILRNCPQQVFEATCFCKMAAYMEAMDHAG